jgi:hypothetical protein
VVGVDGEGAAFQHLLEVADTGDTGKQLPIKGGIPHLCQLKLFSEKSERLPVRRRRPPLLQGCADMVGGGVHHHRQLLVLLRMCQQRGRPQSSPGGVHLTAAVALVLPRVESVRGRRIFAAAGMDRL